VFHDNLITRLKALSQIQLDFDKRSKEIEARFTEKLGEMRKQLDVRWKQIDKFEGSVKTYAETKAGWRRKFSAKEGEVEGLKVCLFPLLRFSVAYQCTRIDNKCRANAPTSFSQTSFPFCRPDGTSFCFYTCAEC